MREEIDNFDDRKELRRKRRIRNQAIAYLTILLLLGGCIGAGWFGIQAVSNKIEQRELAKQEEEQRIKDELLAQEEQERLDQEAAEAAAEAEKAALKAEEEPEFTTEELLDEVVMSCISEMSLEDKVAGLFFVTPEELTGVGTVVQAGDGTKEALLEYPVGGLVYFSKNIQSEEQIIEMLANTVSMSKYPIFLGVDEEGGDVARLASTLKLDNVGDMSSIGETGDAKNAYAAMQEVGTYLVKYGFNVDFAPVADVLTNENNTSIGDRSFGSDPVAVSPMVAEAVKGLQDVGISSCLKHFPGQGNADGDTHDELATTDRTLEEMMATEFVPFQAGIEAGTEFIMVSHMSAPAVTEEEIPCSMSETMITDVLRKELGYNGIVITDAMNMSAITQYYAADEAAIKALKAGADMILMPEDFKMALEGVIEAVNNGIISEERIDDSLARVYRVKYADTVSVE